MALAALLVVLLAALIEIGSRPGWAGSVPQIVVSTAAGAGLATLAVSWLRVARGSRAREPTRWDHAIAGAARFLPAVAFAYSIVGNPATRGLLMSWGGRSAVGAGVVALVLLARRAWHGAGLFGATIAVGIALRAATHAALIHTMGGDMLPLVDRAAGALLRGEAPYHVYHFPWPLPLTYWPGTLLAFVPARVLHVHPHWTNLAAELLLLAVIARTSARSPAGWKSPALPLGAAIFLLPASIEWFRITTAPVAWAAVALALALAMNGQRHRAWGAAFGAALATTPLALVFFACAVALRAAADGVRAAARQAAVAILVLAALVVPFVLWSPSDFVEGALLWFNDLDRFPRQKWNEFHTWQNYPGFAGLFWSLGLERALKPLQALSVALVLFVAIRRRPLPALGAASAAAYLAFIVWNPVIWPYLYQPALVAGLLAVAAAPETR